MEQCGVEMAQLALMSIGAKRANSSKLLLIERDAIRRPRAKMMRRTSFGVVGSVSEC